jgi:hypothetical protein
MQKCGVISEVPEVLLGVISADVFGMIAVVVSVGGFGAALFRSCFLIPFISRQVELRFSNAVCSCPSCPAFLAATTLR